MLGLRFCARAFSSCGERGPLFIAVRGPLTIAASLVAEHRLQMRRLSSCGSRAQLLRGMWDLPGPGLEPVSPALADRFSTTVPPGKPKIFNIVNLKYVKPYWFHNVLSRRWLFTRTLWWVIWRAWMIHHFPPFASLLTLRRLQHSFICITKLKFRERWINCWAATALLVYTSTHVVFRARNFFHWSWILSKVIALICDLLLSNLLCKKDCEEQVRESMPMALSKCLQVTVFRRLLPRTHLRDIK